MNPKYKIGDRVMHTGYGWDNNHQIWTITGYMITTDDLQGGGDQRLIGYTAKSGQMESTFGERDITDEVKLQLDVTLTLDETRALLEVTDGMAVPDNSEMFVTLEYMGLLTLGFSADLGTEQCHLTLLGQQAVKCLQEGV
jgi:hypothetical protein